MKNHSKIQNQSGSRYYGRILNGKYSHSLKTQVVEWIKRYDSFDEIESPAIPYIAAWQENEKVIWYEFISRKFKAFLGCGYDEVPEKFRKSIIKRRVYRYKDVVKRIKTEALNKSQIKGYRTDLREEVTKRGLVEAVYKSAPNKDNIYWLKDQARIEHFEEDKIFISLGCLTIVTKEMEVEAHLKRAQGALRKSEEKYKYLAVHDNLTGLYNTRYLYQALSELIIKSKDSKQKFSLIFMDVDDFKRVVDSHGHLNASRTLQEVAETIRLTLLEPSFGVAYGGDEFVIVLPGTDKPKAMKKADEIRINMRDTTYLKKLGLKIKLSGSFGVATFPDDASTQTDLLALADKAMFHVKERGKDSVKSF